MNITVFTILTNVHTTIIIFTWGTFQAQKKKMSFEGSKEHPKIDRKWKKIDPWKIDDSRQSVHMHFVSRPHKLSAAKTLGLKTYTVRQHSSEPGGEAWNFKWEYTEKVSFKTHKLALSNS